MSAADRWAREPRAGGATERTLVEPGVEIERTLDDEEIGVEPTRRIPTGSEQATAARREWPSGTEAWGSHPADLDYRPTATLVPAEPRRDWDLDEIQELAWSVVGAALYLVGIVAAAIALTMAFAGWVGTLLILIAGALPAGYTLRKSAQRRAEKERHVRLLKAQEQSAGTLDIPEFP